MAFRRGHAYRKAIDLARREFPGAVIEIEEEWGDWLMTQKQVRGGWVDDVVGGWMVRVVMLALVARARPTPLPFHNAPLPLPIPPHQTTVQ